MRCVLALCVALGGCAGSESNSGEAGADGTAATATGNDGDGGDDGNDAGADGDGGSSGSATSSAADTASTAGDDSSDSADTTGGTGLELLYSGPVAGGSIPGWDPDAPRPLIAVGRDPATQSWWLTLAEVAEDGALGMNISEEIHVYGFAPEPTQLYSGAFADAALPGWQADDPYPFVMVGRYAQTSTWFMTLAQVDGAGALSQNVADEVVVWGWPDLAAVAAPSLRYDGPIGGTLDGWDPSDPAAMVGVAELPQGWAATLANIADDGTVTGVVAGSVRLYGW